MANVKTFAVMAFARRIKERTAATAGMTVHVRITKSVAGVHVRPTVAMADAMVAKTVGNAAVTALAAVIKNVSILEPAKPTAGMENATLMRTAKPVLIAVVKRLKIVLQVHQELIQEVV